MRLRELPQVLTSRSLGSAQKIERAAVSSLDGALRCGRFLVGPPAHPTGHRTEGALLYRRARGRPETAEDSQSCAPTAPSSTGPGVVAMGRRARALPGRSPAEGAERPSRLRRVTPPWLPEDYVTQTNAAAVLEQ